MTYDEMYKDWDYLFNTISTANDMTGGYVDSEDLERLLKNPSKTTAKNCLSKQIDYWFQVGLEHSNEHIGKTVFDLADEFPKLTEIAERHFKDLDDCPAPFCRQ